MRPESSWPRKVVLPISAFRDQATEGKMSTMLPDDEQCYRARWPDRVDFFRGHLAARRLLIPQSCPLVDPKKNFSDLLTLCSYLLYPVLFII